jgi:GMP synthase (glutamine-hydrolysing)
MTPTAAASPVTPLARPLRLLVVDGYTREQRDDHARGYGLTASEAYAAELRRIEPASTAEICCPADADASLPAGADLASYDGIFLTGSSLHIYRLEPAVTRQIALMRAIYASGTPCFGSCWGLQVAAVAAGGTVAENPKGREVGFARAITRSEAGRGHALLAGRPAAFDAPAIHLDAVVAPPPGARVLAGNALTPVQAAEIVHQGGTFWGVQYHPEFSLGQLAAILRRGDGLLVREGFCRDAEAEQAWIADLETLDRSPARRDLAWRHGIDAEVLDLVRRTTELRNVLAVRMKPLASARLRQ